MIPKELPDILKLAELRMKHLQSGWWYGFYKWPETFIEGLIDEIEEVKVEFEQGKRVLLEDELGDVFWDCMSLIESLDQSGKISKEKVFERCWTKFSERLNVEDGSDNGDWQVVKKKQKERLSLEQSLNN
jgi:NTP pyrophosphatase (non-canonical NTP hydrolase)